jgi:hypothetical protein
MSDLRKDIAAVIYEIMLGMGAKPELLAIIGSYGDTLEDAEMLDLLQDYASCGGYMTKDVSI